MRSKQTRRPARSVVVRNPAAARPAAAGGNGSLVARLGLGAFERLEGRILMSVSKDVNGYTVVTPSSADQIYYVAANGNDSNTGLSAGAPLKTIQAAIAKSTDGSGDQIVLRRGDTFVTTLQGWTLSGRSASEPFVIGAYTDPAAPSVARPKIASGISTAFANAYKTTVVSNLYIMGVAFEAHNRNYRQPTSAFSVGIRDDAQGGTYGIDVIGRLDNMLVEDCSFQYFRGGTVFQANGSARPSNIKLRRNVLADNYAPSFNAAGAFVTSEGTYAEGVDGLTIEENVYDHNGWMDPAYGNYGAIQTIYNHGAYINSTNQDVVVTGNVFARSGSHGIQARAGGIVTNNLFIDNPIAMSYGYVNGTEKAGGVTGEVSGNVVYGSRDINGAARGWGLEITNTKPKDPTTGAGGVTVKNNIYVGGSYGTQGQPAIQVSNGTNANNPAAGVGVNDLTIQNNIVYGWTKALYLNPSYVPGGSGRTGLKGLKVINNDFQQINATPVVYHGTAYSPTNETWSGNRYDTDSSRTTSSALFQLKVNGTIANQNTSQWQSTVEPTAQLKEIAYPSPNRSPATYNTTLGGTGSLEAYLAEATKLSSKFYRPSYQANAVANYIKEGFAGQRTDALPPGGSLAAEDITAGGGSTQTFTVTWTDDNLVDVTTIGNGDVRVTGPGGYTQAAALVSSTASADRTTVQAVYMVTAPNGAWSASANGTYVVSAVANQVKDGVGNSVPAAAVGTFAVNIAAGGPTASLAATASVTASLSPATLTVTYAAPAGGSIDVGTLDASDLVILGPDGQEVPAVLSSVSQSGNGTPRTAVYRVEPPAGGWSEANNGTYSVGVRAGEVATVAGGQIGQATLGTFMVNVTVPKAVATAPDVLSSTATNPQLITVTYTSAAGMNAATIDANDIRVEGPGYSASAATGLTVVSKTGAGTTASPLVVVYRAPAPAGGFRADQNGTYYVILNDDQVKSTSGAPANGGPIGQFDVAFDVDGPAAVLVTGSIFRPNASNTQLLTVIYSDVSGVDAATIGTGNLLVNQPTGVSATPTLKSKTVSGTTVTAVYELPTPGGLTAARNGNYDVYLTAQGVTDNKGNATESIYMGGFAVNIDGTAPLAFTSVDFITDPLADVTFNVSFDDSPGIDLATLDDNDFAIVGPDGISRPAVLVDVQTSEAANPIASYKVAAPEDGWTPATNGQFNVVLRPNQIADLSGNYAAGGTIATFGIEVRRGIKATVDPVSPNPTAPGLDSLNVHFDQRVFFFDLSNMTLTRDGGPNLLTGSEVLTTADDNRNFVLSGLSPLTQANGQYTLTVLAGGDVDGEFSGKILRDVTMTFTVSAGTPSAVAQAPADITTAGTFAQTFAVTYSDNTGIKVSTLGAGDLLVTGPNGYSRTATFASVNVNSNGTPRVATYAVPAPTGGWSAAHNGAYTIATVAGQVTDVDGKAVPAGTVATFNVNIAAVPVDTTPPTFAFSAPAVTSAAAAATFTVTWTDPSGVNASTIGNGDVIVTNPSGTAAYSQIATLASTTTSGTSMIATYTVSAPAGGWTIARNGLYAVNVRANQVSDLAGNVVAVQFVGAVQVNIGAPADTTPPTATITPVSSPRTTAVDSLTVAFSETVIGFDLSDLTLTRSGGPNLLTSGQGLSSTDGKTYTVSGLTALTGVAGDYVLALKSTGTAIADLANNALVTGASSAWTVTTVVSAPTIAAVSPNPVAASVAAQALTIYGSGFTPTSIVTLRNRTTGSAYNAPVIAQTASQLTVSQVFGSSSSSWTVEVFNDGLASGAVGFEVLSALTVNLRSTADSYVRDGTFANDNFGTATDLVVKKNSAVSYNRNALFQFDLTSFASADEIATAALRLNARLNTAATAVQAVVYGSADSTWTESGVTWNNQPAAGAQVGMFTVSSTTASVAVVDVTAFLKAQKAAGSNLVTFVVKSAANHEPNVVIASDEAAAGQPELRVTRSDSTTPTPTPTTPTPTTPTPTTPTPTTPTPTGTLSLRSSADSYVRDGTFANDNFGNVTDLVVKKNSAVSYNRNGLFKFDLTTVASADAITSASLRLSARLNTAAAAVQVAVFGTDDATWTEAGVTWNNQPAAGTQLGTFSVGSTTAAVASVDVTAFLKAQKAAGRTSVTFVVKSVANHEPNVVITSDEAAANRPELRVTQSGATTPTPTPTTPTPTPTTPTPTPTFAAKFNFQPASAPTVGGYTVDGGLVYGARNGQTYGWSESHADGAKDRGKNSNQLLDTSIVFKVGAKWEVAVPNGTYSVKLAVGDSSVQTKPTLRVEGVTVVNGVTLVPNTFLTPTATVTVADGKLTVDANNLNYTRIDYIEITQTA